MSEPTRIAESALPPEVQELLRAVMRAVEYLRASDGPPSFRKSVHRLRVHDRLVRAALAIDPKVRHREIQADLERDQSRGFNLASTLESYIEQDDKFIPVVDERWPGMKRS